MKTICTYVLLLFNFANLFCQENSLMTDKVIKISSLEENAENIGTVDITKARKLRALLKLDIIDYYRLEEKYDTELKIKVFKESPEYSELKEKLTKEKAELSKKIFYLRVSPMFKAHNYHKGEYDLTKKGFYVRTCRTSDYDYSHKIDKNYFYFPTFPSKLIEDSFYGNREEFFIPVAESIAIDIEENPTDYSFYIVFKITGLETIKWTKSYGDSTIELPKSDKIRLLVVKNSTDEIIYDKVY